MNLKIDSRVFQDIKIPVLWGERVIVQEATGAISVINIGASSPLLEILRDRPAAGISFLPTRSGFQIMRSPDLYAFDAREKTFSSPTLDLPEVQLDDFYIRVGSDVYPRYEGIGDVIGLHVTSDDVRIGAPLPFALFRLVDRRSSIAS